MLRPDAKKLVVTGVTGLVQPAKKEEPKVVDKKPISKEEKKGLSVEERNAIEDYISGDGMWVNSWLRKKQFELNEDENQFLQNMDKATGNVLENTDDYLYRAVDASSIFNGISDMQYESLKAVVVYGSAQKYDKNISDNIISKAIAEKSFTEKGFMSTTKNESLAVDWGGFSGSEKPIILRIKPNDETRGFDTGKHQMGQDEVILQRGQEYDITKIYKKNGEIYVDVVLKKPAVEVNKPSQEPKKVDPPKVEQSKPLVKPDTPFDEIPIAKLEPFKTSKEYLKGVEAVKNLQSKQIELKDVMKNTAKSANAITAQMKRLKFGDEKRVELKKQWDEFVKQNDTAKIERALAIKEIETQGAKDFSEMLNGLSGESTVTYKSTLSNTTVKNKFAKVWEDFKKVSFGYNDGTEITAKGYRKSRAFYDREENSINLPAGTSKYTIMHELAHSLERNNYVMKQAVEFLERRAGDKPIISLGYKDRREVYQDGGFFSNYVGKVYKGDIYKGRRATEVISMGLEAMYRNPKLFYAQDKEHFELIYNLFFKR